MAFSRNYGNSKDRSVPQHFGPNGTWVGGKERAPAAMCGKPPRLKMGPVRGMGRPSITFVSIHR